MHRTERAEEAARLHSAYEVRWEIFRLITMKHSTTLYSSISLEAA